MAGRAARAQRRTAGRVDRADQGPRGREVLRSRRPARRRAGGAGDRRRLDQRRRARAGVHRRGARQPRARHRRRRASTASPASTSSTTTPTADRGWAWQVPLLELTGCQMLLASATLGDMTAIATDLEQRSGRRGHRGHLGGPADAAVPPVADDLGVRQRARRSERRVEPGVRGARQPGGGDRARPGSGEPERHHASAARGDRRRRWRACKWGEGSATRSTA